MIHLLFTFVIAVGILSLQGCSEKDGDGRISQLQSRITGLEQQIERQHYKETEFQINLEGEIAQLLNKVSSLEMRISRRNAVTINPAEKGFQRIDTAAGFFLIACEKVEPHGDGYKLNLIVGNPSTVTYNGFILRVVWGRKFNAKSVRFEEWRKSLREKKRLFASNILAPGGWERVEVVLSPATEEEIGFIQLTMDTGSITFGSEEP